MLSLRSRTLYAASLAALAATASLPMVGGIARSADTQPVAGPTVAADEDQFLRLINEARRAERLPALAADPVLIEIAREHSREMAAKDYFAHESPTPGRRDVMERYQSACARHNAGAEFTTLMLGENIYYSAAANVGRGHGLLMRSMKHRENILGARFEAAGIGTYKNSRGEYWVTQVFLHRRD